jgi:hypothetical protein
MRVERRSAIRTNDAEILEPMVLSSPVGVIENQRHPTSVPILALTTHLAAPLFHSFVVEASLQMPAAIG